MAPSAGQFHQLLGKNIKLLKFAWQKATRVAQSHLAPATRQAEPVLQPVRAAPSQPLHPRAFRQQIKSRWFSTHRFIPTGARPFSAATSRQATHGVYKSSSIPRTRVGDAIKRLNGRTPFASTLRPNLTGGTLGRTAGGYSLGGGGVNGTRYFSHTPTAPAEVIHNVSQGLRALCLSGQRAHFDGVDSLTGEKKWKCVSVVQDEVARKTSSIPKASPGSYVDFLVNPTITAFASAGSITGFPVSDNNTLASEGLMDALKTDFTRAVKDMAAILEDLKLLSSLGDLVITYQASSIRVHFPGCDAESVERLCDELGIQRGIIRQDEDFDTFVGTEIALLFPFAPSSKTSHCEPTQPSKPKYQPSIDWRNMMSPPPSSSVSDLGSTQTNTGFEFEEVGLENPWLSSSSPSGYGSIHSSDLEHEQRHFGRLGAHSPLEYQGIEGIYRFLEQCDSTGR